MNIYISSSWKNREQVRKAAIRLRELGYSVYDFTDPACRKTPEIPPEKYPELFDPEIHNYREYLNKREWREAVNGNRQAINESNLIILLLPCGIDSHADWAYGVGRGIPSIVLGHPQKGERSPVHLWSNGIFNDLDEFLSSSWLEQNERHL